MRELESTLCLACASVFNRERGATITCPHCGESSDEARYELIREYASAAVRFGLQYQRYFERAKGAEKGHTKPFLLPLPDVLEFAAIAAISGIIGGIAHDTVKGAVRRIFTTGWKARRERQSGFSTGDVQPSAFDAAAFPTTFEEAKAIWRDFPDLSREEELEFFCRYLASFSSGFKGVDKHVRSGIVEEIVVDEMARIRETEGLSVETAEEARQLRDRAVDAIVQHPKPSEDDFDGLWTRMGAIE